MASREAFSTLYRGSLQYLFLCSNQEYKDKYIERFWNSTYSFENISLQGTK